MLDFIQLMYSLSYLLPFAMHILGTMSSKLGIGISHPNKQMNYSIMNRPCSKHGHERNVPLNAPSVPLYCYSCFTNI